MVSTQKCLEQVGSGAYCSWFKLVLHHFQGALTFGLDSRAQNVRWSFGGFGNSAWSNLEPPGFYLSPCWSKTVKNLLFSGQLISSSVAWLFFISSSQNLLCAHISGFWRPNLPNVFLSLLTSRSRFRSMFCTVYRVAQKILSGVPHSSQLWECFRSFGWISEQKVWEQKVLAFWIVVFPVRGPTSLI